MTVKERLNTLLDRLDDGKLRELLDYAEFLSWQEGRNSWRQLGRAQFARAYGTNEPEYTSADLKPDGKP